RTHAVVQPGCDVVDGDAPVANRRDTGDVVEEPRHVDRPTVTAREQRDEEGLVGNRDARRAVEHHAEHRGARATHTEEEERCAHGGGRTSTAARAARPPTITYRLYGPGVSRARSTSTWRVPVPLRPAKSQPYVSASVNTRTENRLPAT